MTSPTLPVVGLRPRHARSRALLLATSLLGCELVSNGALAQVPDANGPVCVSVPGLPCPGEGSRSSSSGSGRSGSSSGYSSSGRPVRPSTNTMMLQELQKSLDQMTTPNPATLQRIQKTRMEGDAALQEDVNAQQAAEEQRRLNAQRAAEAARQQQLKELAGSLQGLPGVGGGPALRPGGTPFFGQGGGAPLPSDLEGLREAGSSGFDTRGPLAGKPVALPPEASPPTPVAAPTGELREKPIPPERLTPELKSLAQERETLREQKKQMQAALEQLQTKASLTPTESEALTKLRQDLDLTLNKERYLTFTINEALP